MSLQSEAIRTMKLELTRIQTIMASFIREDGYVESHYKYTYQQLAQKARAFKDSIEWMSELYEDSLDHCYRPEYHK